MADQNFMDLASKTASGIAGTDYMMLVNNSEAYKALVNDVAEAILSKLTSKSFSGLETTAKNVIGALNELNSNLLKRLKYTQTFGSDMSTTSISFTVTNNGGSYLFINANVGLVYILNISINTEGQNILRKILNNSTQELSLSVTGNNVTVTTSGTLWGQTLVIGSNLNA